MRWLDRYLCRFRTPFFFVFFIVIFVYFFQNKINMCALFLVLLSLLLFSFSSSFYFSFFPRLLLSFSLSLRLLLLLLLLLRPLNFDPVVCLLWVTRLLFSKSRLADRGTIPWWQSTPMMVCLHEWHSDKWSRPPLSLMLKSSRQGTYVYFYLLHRQTELPVTRAAWANQNVANITFRAKSPKSLHFVRPKSQSIAIERTADCFPTKSKHTKGSKERYY